MDQIETALWTRWSGLGLPVFWYAKRGRNPGAPAFTHPERVAAAVLVVVAVIALVLSAKGIVQIGWIARSAK